MMPSLSNKFFITVFVMPKYYCDYCDIFLTHDAKRVRKDHNAGWKHAAQVRAHFLAMNQEKMGRCVNEIVREYGQRKELVPVPTPITVFKSSLTQQPR